MSCRRRPGTDPVRVGGQRSVTVARPRVGPPPWAVPPCQELSPHILAVAPGAGRAMGMVAGPGAPNPTPARTYPQVVLSSAAAALTLPNGSASAKARSASARSVRNRVGCQPTRGWACKGPLVGVGEGHVGADQ